jgi:hypothetical protein
MASEMSMFSAVVPVTRMPAPVPASMPETSSRSVCTRSLVSPLVGAVCGTAVRTAVSLFRLRTGSPTEATPSTPRTVLTTRSVAALGSADFDVSTTTVNGPLKPGPKPSDSRS